jgi:CTD small phosphatase-like protein 2
MIIYTASDQSYADSVVNYIDPTGEFFKYRLYRHNCVEVKLEDQPKPIYVKDLRIIRNVPMENKIIIDNSVLSFAFQLENGIPILPYYQNKDDIEMENLKNYLIKLSICENLQLHNGANINLRALLEEAESSSPSTEESLQNLSKLDKDGNSNGVDKDGHFIQPIKKKSLQMKIYDTMEIFKK